MEARQSTMPHTRERSALKNDKTTQRLLQWNQDVRSKHAIQVREARERERQQEDYFVAIRAKVMSRSTVRKAAERNHKAAESKKWKLLELQSKLERERSLREDGACTFQPQLCAPFNRNKPAILPRYHIPRNHHKSFVEENETQDRSYRTHRARSPAVFDRLYAKVVKTTTTKLPQNRNKEVNSHDLDAFLERQKLFIRTREENLLRLQNEHRCTFTPELTKRTHELCLAKRSKSVEELLNEERERRERRLERCIGRKLRRACDQIAPSTASISKRELCCSRSPCLDGHKGQSISLFESSEAFQELLLGLEAQERRMKELELKSPSCTSSK